MTQRILLLALLAAGIGLGARLPVTDLTYVHLSRGRELARTGEIRPPRLALDAGTYEPPAGWLGSGGLHLAEAIGGRTHLRLFAGALFALGLAMLYLIHPGPAGFLASLAAGLIAAARLEISNWIYSWPLFAAFLYLLLTDRRRSPWRVALLPPLVALWASLNREVALGVGLLALAFLVEVVQLAFWLKERSPLQQEIKALLILAGAIAASLAALALVPGGFDNLRDPVLEASVLAEAGMSQWAPVSLRGDPVFFVFALLSAALAGRAPLLGVLLPSLAMVLLLVLGFFTGYFTVFFAQAGVAPAARSLAELVRARRFPAERLRWAALVLGAAGLWALYPPPPPRHPFAGAVEEIVRHGLQGKVFHVPQAAGLLYWSKGADFRPYADTRPESWSGFQDLVRGDRFSRMLEDPEIALLLVTPDLVREELGVEGPRSRGFALVYFDEVALLYVRSEANPSAVERLALERFNPLLEAAAYADEEVAGVVDELYGYFSRHSPSSTTLVTLGRLLLRLENREEALKTFEAARDLDPNHPEILRALARIYLEKGMYNLAAQSSRAALQIVEEEEFASNLALALYGLGDYAEASARFEQVLLLNPENLGARRALVTLYRQLDRPDDSIRHADALGALEARLVGELLDRAAASKKAGNFLQAAGLYQEAHEIRPSDPAILWELALALMIEDRNEGAAAALRELLGADPGAATAHLTLGVLCRRVLGCEPEETRRHLERFLELAPEDPNLDLARDELAVVPKPSADLRRGGAGRPDRFDFAIAFS